MENNDVGIQCKGPQTITDLSKLKCVWLDFDYIESESELARSSTEKILGKPQDK